MDSRQGIFVLRHRAADFWDPVSATPDVAVGCADRVVDLVVSSILLLSVLCSGTLRRSDASLCRSPGAAAVDLDATRPMKLPRKRTPSGFAGNHQRSWLWGRHAVLETLRASRWEIQELFVAEDLSREVMAEVGALAKSSDIQIQSVTEARIFELCHSNEHQGLLARMAEFTYDTLATVLATTRPHESVIDISQTSPLFVICDRIQDAHNFGAILRGCDAMKAQAVIIGERSQVAVTPHVARASAGAVNHQTIVRVSALTNAVSELKQHGVRIVAASEKSEHLLWNADLNGPTAVVIGSEATGIDPRILEQCDLQVAIPMFGGVNSLNAAVAAGILLYECRRQQRSAWENA
jgi:23S rRNA (guanosine2251-2'-O)-methyltransferase